MFHLTRRAMKGIVALIALPVALHAKPANTPHNLSQSSNALSFVENIGQITDQHNNSRKDIDFKVSVPGMSIFIGKGQLHYQWSKTPPMPADKHDEPGKMHKPEPLKDLPPTEMYRMDVTLVGANIKAPLAATEEQAYYERYFSGKFGEDGGLAHTYNRITYTNVYPNIDWVLYTKDNQLKYDFVVHPGGNPADIKMQYGGGAVALNKDGSVTATTPFGKITEQKPYSYIAETKQEVISSYKLHDNVLSFDVVKGEGILVIDPALSWATYYGGNDDEFTSGGCSDANGNSFLAGSTSSITNMATTGAYQTLLNSFNQFDGFVVKFNNIGVRQWSTYYGDAGYDEFLSADCDLSGNVYIGGNTISSAGVTTVGAHQPSMVGGVSVDALLVKFSTSGARLWATYYGGSNDEFSGVVKCDGAGNVYLTGSTFSNNNIATTGTYQPSHSTSTVLQYDAYVVKFNSGGIRQWGTYFGGSSAELSLAIEPDNIGGIYITGETQSTSGIASTGAHKTLIGGPTDAFFAKFNATNGALHFASYYGGTSQDRGNGISCDVSGNFYIIGQTKSSSGISTSGAYQTNISGNSDAYLAKFDNTGSQLWGTYFGGVNTDLMTGIDVLPSGTIYTAGSTESTAGIATQGAYQTVIGGFVDMFLTQWNTNGAVQWSTYYGGTFQDGHNAGTVPQHGAHWSPAGYVFIWGVTLSPTGIATNGAHQLLHGNSGQSYNSIDGFIAQFIIDTMVYIKHPFIDTTFCPGDSFYVKYGVTYNFPSNNTFTVQLSNAAGSFATPVNIGSKTATTPDSIKCVIPDNTSPGTGYRIRIVSSAPIRFSEDNGINLTVKAWPLNLTSSNSPVCENAPINLFGDTTIKFPVVWTWTGPGGFTANTQNPVINNANTTMAGDYILTATSDGCTLKDTVTLVVKTLPATPVATNNGPVCTGDTLKLFSASTTAGVNYTWTGPGGFTSKQQDTLIANANIAQTGMYTVVAVKDGCTSATAGNTIAIVYPVTPAPIANSNTPVCAGGTLYLNTNTVGSTNYKWTGPANFSSTQQAPNIPFITPQQKGLYIVTAYSNGCSSQPDTVDVEVLVASVLGAYASPNDTICGGEVLTLVATVTNSGVNPQYQWYKNNLPVATTPLMTDGNVANGDKYYCTMYSTSLCQMPITIATDTIKMTVHDVLVTPSVSITSVPAQPIPGQLANFTAVPVHPGYLPQYQWLRNGQKVIGAISAIWSAGYLHPTDVINCMLVSSDKCAVVDTVYSNKIVVNFPTSVSSVGSNNTISLYPNPNNGNFTITGNVDATGVAGIEVVNAVGQVVYRDNADISNNQINKQVSLNANSLANGVYLLKITANGASNNIRFTIDR